MKNFMLLFLLILLYIFSFSCKIEKKSSLFIYNWTYYIPDEVIKKFEDKFKVKIVYDYFSSNEEMFAKLKAGGTGYDITFPSGDYTSIMIKEGLLEKLDKSKIPNFKNIDPFVISKIKFDPGNEYSVPYVMGSSGISVNKKYVKDYPLNGNIFLKKELKGKMTLLNDRREVIGLALKTLGYSVNSIDKDQLNQAKDLILKWKENLLKFDEESFGKLFATEEIWVAYGYAENIFLELDENMKNNTHFFIPDTGCPAYIDSMVILKNSKNKEIAYEFINFIHEPEIYAEIVDFLMLPSSNLAAKSIRKQKPNYELEDMINCELKEDLGENIELYNKIWDEIRIGE